MQCQRGCNSFGTGKGAMKVVSDPTREFYYCLHCGYERHIRVIPRSQLHRDFTNLMNADGETDTPQDMNIDSGGLYHKITKYG